MKLQIGDKAPDFTLSSEKGVPLKLSDYRGKKVVVFFYPRDNTPTCTKEACNLRDNYHTLQAQGYEVLGISSDPVKSHLKFAEKYDLPYSLLADVEKTVHQAYGTWVEKSMYGRKYMGTARTTFVINEQGIIEDIIEKVKAKEHASQIIGG